MIQDSVNRISYDGNGLATEFAYPFSITSTQDIKVMLVDTDGTETILTNDYYIDEANSKVNYPGYPPGEEPLPELQPPVLATGQRIVIYRELDVTQLTSLFDQYPFKTIEVMIDKATILLQQMKDAQQRALTLSVSTDTGVSLILPAPSANKSFRWNADGTSLELTADPATVLASVQGYTSQAQGYATTANEKATLAVNGANTATEQATLATEAAATMILATQAEAEAGTDNVKRMSPLRVKQSISAFVSSVPAGTLIDFAAATPPTGYLVCDGSAVSRTTYATLFGVIGTKWGSGNGSTTFNLPPLTAGRFKQGSTTAGTIINAGLPNITGSAEEIYLTEAWSSSQHWSSGSLTWTEGTQYNKNTDSGSSGNGCRLNIDASLSSAIYGASNTVQPPAVTVLPCIKY